MRSTSALTIKDVKQLSMPLKDLTYNTIEMQKRSLSQTQKLNNPVV